MMKYSLLIVLAVYCNLTYAQSLGELTQELEEMYQSGKFADHLFSTNALLMAEYQPPIYGYQALRTYTDSLFHSNVFETVEFSSLEIFNYDDIIVDIGSLEWIRNHKIESGKYWNIWEKRENNQLVLLGHTFGFTHKVSDPQLFRFAIQTNTSLLKSNTTFELKAYNALMEKAVKERNGVLRADFFTDDAIFYPFEDSPKISKEVLLPYLIQYNSGDVMIKDIHIYSIEYQVLTDGLLEYNGFNVQWQVGDYQGHTVGKGIRIWKRQQDGSLKIYREIGLHDL